MVPRPFGCDDTKSEETHTCESGGRDEKMHAGDWAHARSNRLPINMDGNVANFRECLKSFDTGPSPSDFLN